jgi:DNA-binding PucR family transcriptional regulator
LTASPTDDRVAVVGVEVASSTQHPRLADVVALSASAFHREAQTASNGARVYVLFSAATRPAAVTSWVRGLVASLHAELGLTLRAVTATALPGLRAAAGARVDIDRVLDSAGRHPGAIGQVTSLDEARTTVLLDEIVTWMAGNPRLMDPRVRQLDSLQALTLRVYLDSFGDVAAAAHALHVHPNTVRYRIRRIESTLGTSLDDPDVRLLLALSLRAG